MKRVFAPSSWLLSKLEGRYAPKTSAGPHKSRESIPLLVILRNKLKYAINGHEVKEIVKNKEGNIFVDGKVRRDPHYPLGFMDVLSIPKTQENYRILYDVKKRFVLHPIDAKEAPYKLLKIKRKAMGPNKIPYIVTDDGRTIRFPDHEIKVGDSVKLNLTSGKIEKIIKMEIGNTCILTGGNSTGRVGVIQKIDRHLGSYDIVSLLDSRGERFITRSSNVFPIGTEAAIEISLPASKGIKLTPMEEKAEKMKKVKKE